VARLSPVSWRELERVFLSAGFIFERQKGSHRSYVKTGVMRPVVIPVYDEVGVDIIMSNLRTAGITREEYFKLLGN
jgi:predicted RNA binding protein YcfA (HicA-like mRNA interferase family)